MLVELCNCRISFLVELSEAVAMGLDRETVSVAFQTTEKDDMEALYHDIRSLTGKHKHTHPNDAVKSRMRQ
jgi:hypothetical protein